MNKATFAVVTTSFFLTIGCATPEPKQPPAELSPEEQAQRAEERAQRAQRAEERRAEREAAEMEAYDRLVASKPENATQKSEIYMNQKIRPIMKDPDAMQMKFSDEVILRKCLDDVVGGRRFEVWSTTVLVNAKNSLGAYTGNKPYMLFFKDGEVASHAYDSLLKGTTGTPICVGMK